MPHRLSLIALVLTACSLAACASSAERDTGVRIGNETLKQFEAGITTEQWLVAILGPPTSQSPVLGVENTKVFRYATGRDNAGFLGFFTGNTSEITAVTYFIITDGVVTRFWADRETKYTALGNPVEQPSGEKKSE
ncbi:MAG: hypothetical protein AB7G11_06415 [Phycisphaerales bacterium]